MTTGTIEGLVSVAERYYEDDAYMPDIPNDGRAFFGRDAMANYTSIGAKQSATRSSTHRTAA